MRYKAKRHMLGFSRGWMYARREWLMPVNFTDFFPSGAVFDGPARLHRYLLWRTWNRSLPVCVFVGHNPSRAGFFENDMTIVKCCEFARRWGFGSIVMVNPHSVVSTDPAGVRRFLYDPVAYDFNERYMRLAFEGAGKAGAVILAGGNGWGEVDELLTVQLVPERARIGCLGLTKDGGFLHPSRLGYDRAPEPVWLKRKGRQVHL